MARRMEALGQGQVTRAVEALLELAPVEAAELVDREKAERAKLAKLLARLVP